MTWTQYTYTVTGTAGGDFVLFLADGLFYRKYQYIYLDDIDPYSFYRELNPGGGGTVEAAALLAFPNPPPCCFLDLVWLGWQE